MENVINNLSLLQMDTFAFRPQFVTETDIAYFNREYGEGTRDLPLKQFKLLAIDKGAQELTWRVSRMNTAVELMTQTGWIVATTT